MAVSPFRSTALIAALAVAAAIATPALADSSHRGYARGDSGGHADVYFVYRSCGRPYVSYRYGYDRGHRFNRRFTRRGYARYHGRPGCGPRYLRHSDGHRHHGNRAHRSRRDRSRRDRCRR